MLGRGDESAARRGRDEAEREKLFEALRELAEGDAEGAKRILEEREILELAATPAAPRASEVLLEAWVGILIAVVVDTFLQVAFGLLVGLYPALRTIAGGLAFGVSASVALRGGDGGLLIEEAWFLPIWVLLLLAMLLSAAVGFDLAKYAFLGFPASWLKEHLRRAIETWCSVVLPAVLVALILLGAALLAVIAVSGNPPVG
ncbi:MAG: hypothetical protein ACUVYA_01385 [Planctomycetota bacterium]